MRENKAYLFWTIVTRDIVNIVRNPVLLMANKLFPLLLILVLGYLTSGNYGASDVTAYDYYGITMLIFSALNVSITAANSFMEKSLKTSNLRIMYTPIPMTFIYLSKITATFLFTFSCQLTLVLLLQATLHVNFGGSHVIYFMVVLLLLNFFSASVGVWFCCLFRNEEVSNNILSMSNNALAVLGGLFFSLDRFGATTERLSYISPVKWIVDGSFRMIYDHDFTLFMPTVTILLLGSLLLLLGCQLTFKVEDYV